MIFAWISLFAFLTNPATAGFGTYCDRAYALFGISTKKSPAIEAIAPTVAPRATVIKPRAPVIELTVPPIDPKIPVLPAEGLMDRLAEIDTNLGAAFQKLRALDADLVSGKEIPKWHDLEHLDSILRHLRAGKAKAAESGKIKELEALLPNVIEQAKLDAAPGVVAGSLEGAKVERYQPTEYELKRLYQYKLWEINHELPPPLKIRGARIPFDQRRNSLVEEARAIIRAQEEKYPSLYPTTGFPNREALIKAIQKESREAKAVLSMLEKEDVDFVMRRPEKGRWWIPKVGFQNQRITGTSRGTNSPEKRDTAEAFLTFGKKSEYEKIDNDLKPKYGYLRPKPGQILVEDRGTASHYGEDFYVLRKDRLRDRTTWTAGDSLGRGMYRKETDVPQVWHDAFTPWSNRELLVPVTLPKNIAENNTFRIRHPAFGKRSPLEPFPESLPGTAYPEMQYWGPVTLDDVEAFEFSGAPPSGEFLEELLKRDIKIRDARAREIVDWAPPKEAGK